MTKTKLIKALALTAIATSLVACSDGAKSTETKATTATVTATTPSTTDTSTSSEVNISSDASYTIGYGMGEQLTKDPNMASADLNNDKVIAGFQDALDGTKPAISEADMKTSISKLRTKLVAKMNSDKTSKFLAVKDTIYNSDLTPKSDVKDPAVVIYEFFDYQCMYCSKVAPEIEKAVADHKDVQIVFVEFPIFGERSVSSEYAAEVGTAIYKLYGAKAYVKYHDGIFASGEDEGKLQNSTIEKVAKDAGANMTEVTTAITANKIPKHLKDTLTMGFKDLGITGTPYLVVTPVKGASAANTTVIGGYTDYKGIQDAIVKATN
jgi:protein-disulfide isomerase